MGTDPPDAVLLASADPDDFEAFYRRHVDLVTAYVARRVGRPDLTVDVVAETFARHAPPERRTATRRTQGRPAEWRSRGADLVIPSSNAGAPCPSSGVGSGSTVVVCGVEGSFCGCWAFSAS